MHSNDAKKNLNKVLITKFNSKQILILTIFIGIERVWQFQEYPLELRNKSSRVH